MSRAAATGVIAGGKGAMRRGRPPEGLRHIDRLEGSEESKLRLRTILETLSGECTIAEACERLGLSEARLHQLRQAALEAALSGLAPGQPGRPPCRASRSSLPDWKRSSVKCTTSRSTCKPRACAPRSR